MPFFWGAYAIDIRNMQLVKFLGTGVWIPECT